MKATRARVYWDEASWPWQAAALLVVVDFAGLALARHAVGWGVIGRTGEPSSPGMEILGSWSVVTRALLVSIWILYFMGRGVPRRAFGLAVSGARRRVAEFGRGLLWIVPMAAALALIGILFLRAGRRDQVAPPVSFETTRQMVDWILIFVVALPPVEELIYRGTIHPVLRRHFGVTGAVLAGGALFGLLHALYGIDAASLVAYAFGGGALAFVYERTGSLLYPWMLHVATNLAGVWISTWSGLFEALRT
jgi:membrane protease YdiL (CAAX protease family)